MKKIKDNKEHPTRIMGEAELTPGLIRHLNHGRFPMLSLFPLDIPSVSHDIAKEVALSEIAVSDLTEDFAKRFNLDHEQVKDAVGPRGTASDIDPSLFKYGQGVDMSMLKMPETIEDLIGAENIHVNNGRLYGMTSFHSVNAGAQYFQLTLLDKHLGMIAKDIEEATNLMASLTDADLARYAEKGVGTLEELRFALLLLKASYVKPIEGITTSKLEGKLFLLNLYDIVQMGKEGNVDLQRITTLAKRRVQDIEHGHSPAYKLGLMKDNVKAHEYFLDEMERIAYYAPAMETSKRMKDIFFAMYGAEDMSQNQMTKFYFDLGDDLVGEIECPVDQSSWGYIQQLLHHTLFAIEAGHVSGQDVEQLAGAHFNGYNLGDEVIESMEYVTVHRRDDLDVFYVIPLSLWHRPK